MRHLNGLLVLTFFGSSIVATGIAKDSVVRRIRRVHANGEITNAKVVKRVLFIHSGLMRNSKHLWPIWEKNFIKPNQKAGVEFTIAVATDLRLRCDPDAEGAFDGRVATANTCSCTKMSTYSEMAKCRPSLLGVTEDSKASFRREIQQTYRNASKGGAIDIIDAGTENLPTSHFNSVYTRARPILQKYENQTFDYIIVIRPDVVLADNRKFAFDENEFNLASLCDSHPGMNLISGSFKFAKHRVHHRDWDWGYLLCDGKNRETANPVLFGRCSACKDRMRAARKADKECVPPFRSADFIPSKTGAFTCRNEACTWFEGMEGKMRLGNLDDTLFAVWPDSSAHRGRLYSPFSEKEAEFRRRPIPPGGEFFVYNEKDY